MSEPRITSFEELDGHLDGLVQAARQAPVDPQIVDFLATVRQRLQRIHSYLTDTPPDTKPPSTPPAKTVSDTDDCLEQFGELTEQARGGGLPSVITNYLHTARLRVRFCIGVDGGRRIVKREGRSGTAELQWDHSREEVEVVDGSAYGVGVIGRRPLAPDTVVQLTTEGQEGNRQRYDCLVVYCRGDRSRYQIGLEIFAISP